MTLFIRGSNQNFIDYNSVKNTPNMVSDIILNRVSGMVWNIIRDS